MPMRATRSRNGSFDGFRGLAMLLVLLYHAFCRWPGYMPYGGRFASAVPFQLGGVWLFFILSGFFALMTLEQSANFGGALYKRWLRLFPAMLIASILLLVTGPLLPERPLGIPEWKNTIPGLVFLHPDFIERITGTHLGLLEGSFWSLFVDMKFYLLFALAYFKLGTDRASMVLAGLFMAWCGTQWWCPPGHPLLRAFEAFSVPMFGWFACGVFAFRFHRRGKWLDLVISGTLGTLATLVTKDDLWIGGSILLLLATFLLALRSGPLCGLFNCRPLLFIASISYPLFLLHEQALVALTIRSGTCLGACPVILLPVLPLAALILLAWLVARVVEPGVRRGIHRAVMSIRRTLPQGIKEQLRPWMAYARSAGSLS